MRPAERARVGKHWASRFIQRCCENGCALFPNEPALAKFRRRVQAIGCFSCAVQHHNRRNAPCMYFPQPGPPAAAASEMTIVCFRKAACSRMLKISSPPGAPGRARAGPLLGPHCAFAAARRMGSYQSGCAALSVPSVPYKPRPEIPALRHQPLVASGQPLAVIDSGRRRPRRTPSGPLLLEWLS